MIRVAIDVEACKSVIHNSAIPVGVKVTANTSGKYFSGAGGEVIDRFGKYETLLTSSNCRVKGKRSWQK